jgi:hypothetical protein
MIGLFFALSAAAWRLAALVFGGNRHGLQRWRHQAECDGQVMEPIVQWISHTAPLQGDTERQNNCASN